MDERCVTRISRLERANSIKETTRSRPVDTSTSLGRRWSSRETLYSPRVESPSAFSSNSAYSGVAIGANKYTSKGWSDHVSMVQDDVKAKLTSAKALLYGEWILLLNDNATIWWGPHASIAIQYIYSYLDLSCTGALDRTRKGFGKRWRQLTQAQLHWRTSIMAW